ncbi:MAG: ASCH domain-containing protein [Thermoplasmata archaeon]|nr:ASCH domain-containing protein [Thermoplasmata archaeon]
MKSLNFKKKYRESIERGEKIATLRMGIKNFREDEMVRVVAGGKEIGRARIVKVRNLKWNEISNEDAMLEGMKDKGELEKELKNIYGKFDNDEVFTQIVFTMMGDKDDRGKKV